MNQDPDGATILVIDDDPVIRLMTTEALLGAGYTILEAESAEDGLALFGNQPIDLVLLDVMLPGMDGFRACSLLRGQPRGADVPIIVMTGLDDRRSIIEAYDSGATDFITKPMVWDLLPYRVRYALRTNRALRDTARSRALLARSQHLANMGSWEWSTVTGALDCSEELHRIHGTAPDIAPRGLATLLERVHPEDHAAVEEALQRSRTLGQPYGIEFRIVQPDGSLRRLFEQTDVERDSAGAVVAMRGIRLDITQQAEANRRIRTLANYDPLTGLANRSRFREMLGHWLAQSEQRGVRSAVLFLDLDRFKLINETLGPAIGDEVLRTVGDRLHDCLRSHEPGDRPQPGPIEDGLARLAGDEFTLLLPDVMHADHALRVARRLTRALLPPVMVDGHELTITASIGIAMTPRDGVDVDSLLRSASTAMHVAKEDGRNQIRFYDEAMSADVKRRLTIEIELRRALDNGELRVHYQPKVDARTSEVVGAEALVRWQHPQRGMIGPSEFIAVAVESGLVVPMTDWVIGEVCRQLARWQRTGVRLVPVSINLDVASLQSDALASTIQASLAQTGVAPQQLEFEVTESSLMRDLERASQRLTQLKGLGLKLSIDDFGTGYSSLTYLKRFPVDVLKIDRSFVKDLCQDPNDAALTSAIIAMGTSLNLELVAEGVETWGQADFLIQRGCYLVQGFLFAQALSGDAFAGLIGDGLLPRLAHDLRVS